MAGYFKAVVIAKVSYGFFHSLSQADRYDFAAVNAGKVMVMRTELLGQFKPVFPAGIDFVNNTDLFKKLDVPVYTGPVGPFG